MDPIAVLKRVSQCARYMQPGFGGVLNHDGTVMGNPTGYTLDDVRSALADPSVAKSGSGATVNGQIPRLLVWTPWIVEATCLAKGGEYVRVLLQFEWDGSVQVLGFVDVQSW
jgi:hypothetical protein